MTKTRCFDPFLALFVVATLTATLLVNGSTIVHAIPPAPGLIDVQVDHAVQIRNGGLIVINDTVRLSAEGEKLDLDSFALGFPFIYRSNLDYVFAHDASKSQLEVKLDIELGKIGFYGVEIRFPQLISISSGGHYEFTVVFVFSNLLSSQILPYEPESGKVVTAFNATFPAYPSLTWTASSVNLTIVLPSDLEFLASSFYTEGITFTNRTSRGFQILNYTKSNVSSFAYEPFWFAFAGVDSSYQFIETEKIRRNMKIESINSVLSSDSYEIIAKAGNLSALTIQLPRGSQKITAWDALGNPFKEEDVDVREGNTASPTNVTLTFSPPFMQNESTKFELTYQIPWENIISQMDWQDYRILLPSFGDFGWTIRKLAITLTLPEGAEFTSTPDFGMIRKDAFQETLSFVYHNITPFQDLSREVAYEYPLFWASFRPTLWVGTAVAILSILALLWRAPRPAAPIPTIPVRSEELKSYVDAYEQKRQSLSKLETLEERARKRKIPRRRYRVRKRTLESRLSILTKDLGKLRDKLQAASPKYADMMRQIEIAEADMEGIDAGIRRTETRYRRGEISTAVYHKLLEDYYRRRERARTTIDGIIIRLREEIA